MATVLDVTAAFDKLTHFARTPDSPADDRRKGLAQLAPYRDGGIFASKFSGSGGWERHTAGDEIVHVVDGATLLHLLPDSGPRETLELRAGSMVIVPTGVWHRFESAAGVTLMSITPLPTEHPPVDVDDPR
ncbi:MAG: cupin domain-containing protein [Proteobacteria bacterium]|nr:cupin domain-containing protein [Pseudomonadota bacterium]